MNNGDDDSDTAERNGDPSISERVSTRPDWLDEYTDPPRGARLDDDLWDDEPRGWRSTVDRLRTTPRAAAALCAVGVIAAVVAAFAVFSPGQGNSDQYPVVNFAGASSAVTSKANGKATSASSAADTTAEGASATAPESAAAEPKDMVVAVVGLVRAPGLHRLPPGSRVADALAAARGAIAGADTAGLNLAQTLRDGEQVVVGVSDPAAKVKLRSAVVTPGSKTGDAQTAAAGATTSGSGGDKININTGSASDLDRLPGVGAATAAAIIAYREEHGPFATVDDLGKVSGIGDAKLAKIKPQATV